MTLIRGGMAGPNGLGGSFANEVETDRSLIWFANGATQKVVKGFTYVAVPGVMALDFIAGAALVGERAADGTASLDRGYLVWADSTTRVTFGVASASARNDAVVAAFVDTEDGAVGTGALAVGAHLVVIPGVSGTTTVRTDAQITAWLGRGGWIRLIDVPVAAASTQINTGTLVVVTASYPSTLWQNYTPVVKNNTSGVALACTINTARYRLDGETVDVVASVTLTAASTAPAIGLPIVAKTRLHGGTLLISGTSVPVHSGVCFMNTSRDFIYAATTTTAFVDTTAAGNNMWVNLRYEKA